MRTTHVWLSAVGWLLVSCQVVLDAGDDAHAVCQHDETLCTIHGVASCVDTANDARHCGACGHTCPSGLCAGGRCCVGQTTELCEQDGALTCVDPETDPLHCGACGNVCASGACSGGKCCDGALASVCSADGLTSCVDLASDERHCGQCNASCVQGTCIEARCCTHTCRDACLPARFEMRMAVGELEGIGAHGYDVDGDGYGDALWAHQLTGTVHVYWGNARGLLDRRTVIASGRIGAGLAVGDVDGDGRADIVASIQGRGPPLADRIRIFRGKGGRAFAPPLELMQGDNPGWVALLDANADGRKDIVVRLPGRKCTALRVGDGRGGFGDAECLFDYATIADEEAIKAADVDGDGTDELVELRLGEGLYVHGFAPNGTIASSQKLTGSIPSTFEVFDLDRNGVDEIIGFELAVPTWSLIVREQPGPLSAPSCSVPETLSVSDALGLMYLGGITDFDGDHVLDVVGRTTCGECTSNLYLHLGRLAAPCEELGTCTVE